MNSRYPVRKGQTLQLVSTLTQDAPPASASTSASTTASTATPARCGSCQGGCTSCTNQAAAQEPVDLTGWTVTAQVRTKAGELIDNFVCTIDPDQVANAGQFTLKADTSAWPLGLALTDLRFAYGAGSDATVDYTDTIELMVQGTVTAP